MYHFNKIVLVKKYCFCAVIPSIRSGSFLLIQIKDLVKYYGEKKIIELPSLSVYSGDKIALTGKNGAGKTTLLKMIAGETEPDRGSVTVKGSMSVISQIGKQYGETTDPALAGKLGAPEEAYSGGEIVKSKIAAALSSNPDILLADEPGSNLDIKGILLLEELLLSFKGGLILVSHDRAMLKKVCNKVLEISRDKCRLYDCGYEEYLDQKGIERETDEAKYEQYASEKQRLKRAAIEKSQKSAGVRKAPKRMGNSEARLHKMGDQKAKEKLDRSAKAALTRLEKLEKVEKPWVQDGIFFDVKPGAINSPVLIRAENLCKSYGERKVLENCSFIIPNNKKTALIGDNGAGKTTLLEMIARGDEQIKKCQNLKTGYFRQDMSDIEEDKSILENALSGSVYDQQFTRTILARLLFDRERLGDRAGLLSGGEKIKLSIAKIILSNFNLLILDEPANYLDIESREALESVLRAYPGAVLFVSHDREFVRNIADRVIEIKYGTVYTFDGVTQL